MKESLKITKTFSCGCGREYSLELSTDLSVENMQIDVSCPSCGEKRTVSMGSLLQNKGSGQGQQASPDSTPPLSFMDSLEASASGNSEPSSSESSASATESASAGSSGASETLSSMEDEGESIYTDMFGDG